MNPIVETFSEKPLYMPLKDKCFSPDHAIINRVEILQLQKKTQEPEIVNYLVSVPGKH